LAPPERSGGAFFIPDPKRALVPALCPMLFARHLAGYGVAARSGKAGVLVSVRAGPWPPALALSVRAGEPRKAPFQPRFRPGRGPRRAGPTGRIAF